MQNKKFIIFDFDGTIYDSGPGIMKGARYALESFGIEVNELSELRCFVGPPLWDSFMDFYGFSRTQADQAVEKYREYYVDKGMTDGEIYTGIPGLLRKLKEQGKELILATSKSEKYFPYLLEALDLQDCFHFVAGSTHDGSRSTKEDVLAYTLERCGIIDRSLAVMVGDRKFDIIGANAFGIESIGVLYGYGSLSELQAAGADYIAADVEELEKILLGKM
jgi:phosphoglycolate phosphatase